MTGFPPPTLPTPEPATPNFWQRRNKFGKAAVVAGGLLVALTALGAVLPDPDEAEADVPSTAEAAESEVPASTEAPATTEAPTTTSSAPETTVPAPTTTQAPEPEALLVSRVVDGDTVDMSDGTTVRLIGIDTPERGECGYQDASITLAVIVDGQSVTLTPGARDDVDRYGRLLRYLDLESGVDANLAMIESGQAIARYDSRDGYGRHAREDAYVAADATGPAFCATSPPATTPAPVATVAPATTVAPPPPPAAPNVYYQNCDAVRAAGAAPIYPGDPGFQSKFDRDKDGIGCE